MQNKSLDTVLVSRGLADNLSIARALIIAGRVYSSEVRLDKPGLRVKEDTEIAVREAACPYVSRGGLKLAHAISKFGVSIKDRVVIDLGASTGGFTDCLIKHGARHVVSVDVGYGVLDGTLRKKPNVSVLERTNARLLQREALDCTLSGELSLATIDVSFISLLPVIERVHHILGGLEWIALFKPQFEVDRSQVRAGGIVTDRNAITLALGRVKRGMASLGLELLHEPIESPIVGKKAGNVEYLLHYGHSIS